MLLAVALVVAGISAPLAADTAAGSSTAPDGVQAVYAGNDGSLHAVEPDGTVYDLGVDAAVAGRTTDLDDDGTLETPYVDGNGVLRTVEPDGTTTRLAGDVKNAKSSIAVADYDGDGTKAVFYANTSDSNYIYKVEVGDSPSAPERVAKAAANGIAGTGDVDGDDGSELVFAGTSSTIKYLDDGSVVGTGTSDIGSNNGYGLGDVADVNGDGTARVTVVTGSGNIALIDNDGEKQVIKDPPAAKSAISTVDWDDDGGLEILYRNTDGKLSYAHLDGSSQQIEDASGTAIAAGASAGVAASSGLAAPRVSNYSVSNPAGREVRVSFTADAQLSEIAVNVSGPDSGGLGTAAFAETGDGPYTYTATYDAAADGEYAATLADAVGPDGEDGAQDQEGTVTVETPEPTVENVSVSDATDGDGVVGDNHTVAVTAEASGVDPENGTVEADASPFGAGTVDLQHQSGSTWTGQFTVDGDGVAQDGNRTLDVTATNRYGNTASGSASGLVVDTTPPDVDPGPSVTVGVDTNVTFDGDGTTDLTGVERYQWSFGDGTNTTGITATHSYETEGNYIVTLTAEDAAGNVASDTTTVTVEQGAGEPKTGPDVQNVTVRDATDGDGILVGGDTVAVTAELPELDPENGTVEADAAPFGAGTVALQHQNGSTWTGQFTVDGDAASDGSHAIAVAATNPYGTDEADSSERVVVDTTPPDADAGPSVTVGVGTSITFDGDGSTDLTSIERYDWSFGDGATATGVTATHSYDTPGTYTVTLTVEDAAGNVANDTTTVTVEERTGEPTTDPSDSEDATEPATGDDTDQSTDDETVIYVTPDEDSAETDPATTVETTTVEQGARLVVENADDGSTVSLDVPAAVTRETGVTLDGMAVQPTRGGAFQINVSGNASAPEGVSPVGADRAVDSLAYWQTNETIDDDQLDGVTFEFAVDASRVDGGSADAVTLYRYDDGAWETYDPQVVAETNGSYHYRAHVPGLSVFAVGVQQPGFAVTDADLGTEAVTVNESVSVTATVRNDGATAATRTLALELGNETAAERTVTVPAGAERTVEFVTTPERAGTFSVAVENTSAGTLRVSPAETTPTAVARDATAPADDGWPGPTALLWVLLGALVAGGAAYYHHRTRHKGDATLSERLGR